MDKRFLSGVKLVDGSLNHSKPRDDGKRGSKYYGTVHLNLADPRILQALADGKTSVPVDVRVVEFERKDGSGTFLKIEGWDIYEPEEKQQAAG